MLNTRSQRNEGSRRRMRKSLEKGRRRETTTNRTGKIEHETTHLTFRIWCIHCIKGRRETSPRNPSGLHVHGRRRGRENVGVLVARERATRAVLSTVVPRKPMG